MTVAELISMLQTFPQDIEVYVNNPCPVGGHEMEVFPVLSLEDQHILHLWIQPLGTQLLTDIGLIDYDGGTII